LGAVVVVVALTLGILFLHERIDRHIQSLKGLWTMDIIVAALMVIVALVFVGIAIHAAR